MKRFLIASIACLVLVTSCKKDKPCGEVINKYSDCSACVVGQSDIPYRKYYLNLSGGASYNVNKDTYDKTNVGDSYCP